MNKNRKLINAFLVSTMMLSGLTLGVSAAEGDTVTRLGGKTRVETALEVSGVAHDKADSVVVAGYNGSVDALTGTLLASAKKAPLLFVSDKDEDIKHVQAEIAKLGAKTVYILGDTKVVSEKVRTALAVEGTTIVPVAGHDRFDTAVAVAEQVGSETGHAFLTYDGRNGILADALSAGPASGMKNSPILLTGSTSLPTQTITALTDLNITEVTIVGGRNIVNDDIIAELKAMDITVDRVSGDNRWETAEEVANTYFEDAETVVITNDGRPNNIYADAVVGGYLGAHLEAPILLTQATNLPDETKNFLDGKAMFAYVLGSDSVVSKDVLNEVEEILKDKEAVEALSVAKETKIDKIEKTILTEEETADKTEESIAAAEIKLSEAKEIAKAEVVAAETVEEVEAVEVDKTAALEELVTLEEQAAIDKAKELAAAKVAAIEELKAAGVTSEYYFNLINNGKTIEGITVLKEEILAGKLASEAAKELAAAKATATERIKSVLDEDYAKNNKEELAKAKADLLTAIEEATTPEEVQTALDEFEEVLAGLETDKEIKEKQEAVEAVNKAKDTFAMHEALKAIGADLVVENLQTYVDDLARPFDTIEEILKDVERVNSEVVNAKRFPLIVEALEKATPNQIKVQKVLVKEFKNAEDTDLITEYMEAIFDAEGKVAHTTFEEVQDAINLVNSKKEAEEEDAAAAIKKLADTKTAAIEELKAAGVTSEFYFDLINKGKTVEGVEALKEEILKGKEESDKEAAAVKKLADTKTAAIEELKAAGVTSEFYFDLINKGKTVEGVEALKEEILKGKEESDKEEAAAEKAKKLVDAKTAAIKDIKEAGVTSNFYINQIKNAKTIEGVESLKNLIIESAIESQKEAAAKKEELAKVMPVNSASNVFRLAEALNQEYFEEVMKENMEKYYEALQDVIAEATEEGLAVKGFTTVNHVNEMVAEVNKKVENAERYDAEEGIKEQLETAQPNHVKVFNVLKAEFENAKEDFIAEYVEKIFTDGKAVSTFEEIQEIIDSVNKK